MDSSEPYPQVKTPMRRSETLCAASHHYAQAQTAQDRGTATQNVASTLRIGPLIAESSRLKSKSGKQSEKSSTRTSETLCAASYHYAHQFRFYSAHRVQRPQLSSLRLRMKRSERLNTYRQARSTMRNLKMLCATTKHYAQADFAMRRYLPRALRLHSHPRCHSSFKQFKSTKK